MKIKPKDKRMKKQKQDYKSKINSYFISFLSSGQSLIEFFGWDLKMKRK